MRHYKILTALATAAALAGCGSAESKLEKEVQQCRPLFFENIPDDARLPSTLEIPDDREELRAERDWYRNELEALRERRIIPMPPQRGRLLDKNIADVSMYNPPPLSPPAPFNPGRAVIVGDQASSSDTIGAVDVPPLPPYEPIPEFPWKIYSLLVLGCAAIYSAYAIGHSKGKKKEERKARKMIDGLVKKFGNGRSVDELLREVQSPN